MSKEIILSEEEYKDLERKHTEEVMGMGPEFYRQRKLGDYEEEPTQQTSYGKRYTNRDANQIAQQKIADKQSAKISPITLRDMTKDLDTFRKFDKEGAFESDLSVAEMLWNGSKAMVVDSYDWIESLPQRVMSNFGIQTIPTTNIPLLIPPSGMTKKQKAQYDKNKKRIQAKGQATTLQTLGNISLNYELMGEGLSLLKDKMINKITGKSGSVEEDAERYQFWKSLADIEERRQTVYAELATNDFLMMGGDPEIREMIKNGEVQPDYGSAMGGSMWADPLNYIPLTAGFRVAKGGTSFTGMERALMNDARDSMILRAGMEQLDKVKPSPELTQSMKSIDGFIRENLDKLDKIAKNRPVALEDFANKLPQGHPLRDKINQALNGVNATGKVSKTGWAVGGAGVVAGKSVEGLGALFEFASRLLPETGINLLMKMGLSEEVAVSLLKNNKLTRLAGMAGGSGLFYGAMNLLTDDEMVATLLTAGFVLPQLAKTYGRDIATMSRELMSPETTLPYWKRMSMRGAEDISSRTIDRSSWSPIKSLAEDVVGASSGKVKERLFDASGQLQSMKKGGLYGIANALDKSKAGRYLETGGRMAKGGLAGGTMGGIFGYVAGGGEQDEAGWGGVGAGFTLGAMGALAGNYGRFRGARSSAEIIQMRHGDLQYYKNKLLPESQKNAFNSMPKEQQIAYASASMSRPATEFRFVHAGVDEVGGKQYIEADGTAVVEVNVDSGWSLQPLLHHEITHYIEEVGGKAAFDNMLIGNPLMETSGMFTKLDKDGKPIKKFDENGNLDGYEVSDAFNELKFKYFIKFGKYKEVYDKSVKMSLAHGTSNKNAHEFAYRRVIQKIDQMEVMRDKDGVKIADADTKTAREIVAEHGVDFLLNDPRRYRDLHEGWVGAFLRNVVDSPLLNNASTLRGMLAKLGATFRENGLLASDNNLFGSMQRIEPITNLLRKYNRQMEGLSKDQMDKKFPLEESESTIADVQMTGQDFARHPELIENLRAGTFLQVDSNGNIIPNAPMSPKEIKAYNIRFTEAIKEATEQLENEEGLPEGHVRSQTTKTNETRFEGRYISDKVLDIVAQKGGWNKAQIDTLRSVNRALRYYKNEKGGTDWLFTYFKASKKGKYVSAKVQNKIDIPYGIEITKDGNINIRVIDLKLFHRNIERAFKNYQPEIKRLYGNDLVQAESLFLNDVHKYHMNHAEGKQGMTGLDQNPQIAEGKANFINALFGKSSKAHAEANPWLAQVSGNKRKAPSPTYRSRRIERIGKVQQLSGKQHVDINKILTAFMPEKRVDMDALLKQDTQMRSTNPNYMPKFMYTPAEFTGANPKKTPSDFQKSFDILKFEQGGKFFDKDTKQDITNKTYDGMSISTLKNRPEAETSDVPAELPVGHSSKVGSDIKINMVNGKAGSTKFKWIDDKGEWDTKRQENESWLVSIENSSLDGNGRKVPEGGKDTDHVFARELISEVPTKLATYPKSKTNPRGRPTAKGDIVTGNVVGTMKMGKYNHHVYDKVTIVPKGEGVNYIPAFHGSRYDFNKFSTDKIGTGEGAQAFGYGLYFAGSKDVAKFYKDKLSRGQRYEYTPEVLDKYEPLIDEKKLDLTKVDKELSEIGEKQYQMRRTVSKIDDDLIRYKQQYTKESDAGVLQVVSEKLQKRKKEYTKASNALIKKKKLLYKEKDAIEKKLTDLIDEMQSKGTLVKDEGKMYEVDLKPKEDEYLLWDKPFSGQSELVKQKIKPLIEKPNDSEGYFPDFLGGHHLTGEDFYNHISFKFEPRDLGYKHPNIIRANANASATLKEVGIRGIKYLDGLSRKKGEGEYNYVIFDDADVEITAKYMPKFEGASDNVPKIIEDINIATDIFGRVNAFNHAWDRSWHINTLVKRVLMNAENDFLKKRIQNAEKRKDAFSIERGKSKLENADKYFYYMKYPLQDLVASLPDIKSRDVKRGLNSARNADPFEPIRDNFQGGQKRPLQDILQEMANVHQKIFPEDTNTLNEIRGIGEILKDDYGADIKPEFLDELYRRYRNLSKEEHEQFKIEEQKNLKELFNPEFNDIEDIGLGTKLIKPIDPDANLMPAKDGKEIYQMSSDEFKKRGFMRETDDALTADYYETMKEIRGEPPITEILNLVDPVANHRTIVEQALKDGKDVTYDAVAEYPELTIRWMAREQREGREIKFLPSAERKPVTFSARPEEIITLDSENIKNFMPAHKNVRLEDYLDYPIFALASDRVGVGTMLVGTNDYKIPVDFDAQGGRGFMYLYEDGGWAFKESGTAQTFLSRVAEVAGDRDEVLVGITVLSEINHLNSVFGQLSLAQAYEAALRSGHISKDQMKDHLQSVMTKVAIQKYGKDVFYTKDDPKKGIKKGDIKHKEGEYKISKKYRDMLLSIDSVDEYKNQILKKQFPFSVHSEIIKRNNLAETAKDKAKGVTLPIKGKQAKELGLEMQSIANDIIDPQLRGLPVGQVVALLKVPVNQKPKKVDFHLSYPWQIKGEAIGFLDQFKALKDLTSNKKVFDKYGNVGGQPLQTVMPVFDKLNPALYMPNYKPMLDAKVDNISGLVMPKIKQDKFSPQQFKAKLSEVKGAKEMAEDLGLLDYIEGKKSVTKDEIDQYISDNRKSIMLRMENGYEKYKDVQMEGGKYLGYNEILFVLPESKKYPFSDVSGGHFNNDRTLMHMRVTKRMLDDGSDGEEGYPMSFHIEEMQSDWHQYGRGEGYADPAYLDRVYDAEMRIKELRKKQKNIKQEAYEKLRPSVEALINKYANDIENMAKAIEEVRNTTVYDVSAIFNASKFKDYQNVNQIDMYLNGLYAQSNNQLYKLNDDLTDLSGAKLRQKQNEIKEYETKISKIDNLLDEWGDERDYIRRQLNNASEKIDIKISEAMSITEQYEMNVEMGGFNQSPAPFKNSWQHRVLADAVQMAVEQGHTYLTWTTGKRSAEMARLDNTFESVEVRYTAKGYLKPDGSNKYAINAVGKDQFGENTIRKSLSEKELIELIGKDYAEEAITRLEKSDKPNTANKVELTDIVVPHKGRRLLYDSILPSVAKRIAKTLGTRPPTKANIITQEWGVVPQKVGDKARHKTQEVWVMELPVGKEKLHELPLYMPSMMPLQNIPVMPKSMKERQTMYFVKPQIRVAPSKASQARELEPENSYFNN